MPHVYSEQGAQPRLLILDRDGTVQADWPVGPNGLLGTPEWTPDGRYVFLQAYPERGRRIVVVDTTDGALWDLSQAGWDASFSLSPDGTQVALVNDRGGAWLAPIERR